MADPHGQTDSQVRFDWGPVGAAATRADVVVVVDVLSFTSAVTIAVERGMRVYPYRWNDDRAATYAAQHDAVLAVGRLEAGAPGAAVAPSLSPAGLLTCEPVTRLVLPSPNGATIAASVLEQGATVAAGCLRNAGAVGAWLVTAVRAGRSVAVIAAGERWRSDSSLRPSLEDQLGAGAILAALGSSVPGESFSPEARATADLFDACRNRLGQLVRGSASARELIEIGFDADVAVAAELDTSPIVPVLTDGAFTSTGAAVMSERFR